MIKIYKTENGETRQRDEFSPGCWINMIAPNETELKLAGDALGAPMDFLKAALDEEETSRVESDDGQTLIIIDVPSAENGESGTVFVTIPLGIVVTETGIATVSLRETTPLREMSEGFVRGINTTHKTKFIFTLMLRIAGRFMQYLREIEKISSAIERKLYESSKNKELVRLLGIEKSLVFFSTSLKADEVTLEKVLRGRVLKLYEEDQDLLEDVLIEFRQAIEMTHIHSSIFSGTMEVYAGLISNNLNVTMKILTALTVIVTIPNIIFSFYGMNVERLPFVQNPIFATGLAVLLCLVTWLILKKRNLF